MISTNPSTPQPEAPANVLPDRVAVLGSGGGGLTIAGELGLKGVQVMLADLPQFAGNLAAIDAAGGVKVGFRSRPAEAPGEPELVPVAGVSTDPAAAIAGVPLVIVCVPSFGHAPFAELLAPAIEDGQTILFVGEGGGAISLLAALRRAGRQPDATYGETNSLPYGGAFIQAPGVTSATRKTGGTLVAAVPSARTADVHRLARAIWPWVTPAQNAWETVLLNFNAIDDVATMLCNLGTIQRDLGPFRLWGDGATPGVANVIDAVNREYLALRSGLGLTNTLDYQDYLVEQGLVAARGATAYDTLRESLLADVQFATGPAALEHRFISEDLPYSLVLASSLGREIGVATPVIDGLIAIGSAAAGRDYAAAGRTLADWAMDGLGAAGLVRAVEAGSW